MSEYAEIKETIGEAETIYCTICNPYMLPSGYDTIDIKKDIKNLIDIIEKQRVHFGRIIGYTENLFDNVPAWRANQIAKEALKLTEE